MLTSQKQFEKYFPDLVFKWKDIYILPHVATVDTQLCIFQYKLLHNVLYLSKNLFIFITFDTKLCTFCNLKDETTTHLFANCFKRKILWNSLKESFKNTIDIPLLAPYSIPLHLYKLIGK